MRLRIWTVAGATALAAVLAVGLQGSASAGSANLATISAQAQAQAAAAALLPFPASSETVFHPITPVRILDTRGSLGGHNGNITSGSPFALQVTGVGGVLTGASAVAFNVTVVNPTTSSWLTIYPTGGVVPTVSNINYSTGQTVANFSTVKLSTSGKMTIKPGAGSTDVLVDVAGYYSKSTAWGTDGYIGWVAASDAAGFVASHSNNGQAITKTNNGTGNNTIRFNGTNIGAFIAATGNIQVSVAGTNLQVTCATIAGTVGGDDTNVTVACEDETGTPVNVIFYLQLTG